ncbi:MAG: hypothetical protein ACRDJH_24450 [Thermomicrobiales bacterium]
MDFVVVGFGLGAFIVLVGIAVRDLVPRLRRPDSPEPSGDRIPGIYSIQHLTIERWAAACQIAGQSIMLGGGAIILAAIGGIAAGLDNGDGARLVLAVALVAIGGFAVRFGMLANELFPIDRRSRERARQLAHQAAQSAMVVPEQPKPEKPKTDDKEPAVPVAPVVAAEAATEPAAIGSNGASVEPIPAEAEVETASTPPDCRKADDESSPVTVAGTDTAAPVGEQAPLPAEEHPQVEEQLDTKVTSDTETEPEPEPEPAAPSQGDVPSDSSDVATPSEAGSAESDAVEQATDEGGDALPDEQEGVTEETETPPEVAAAARSTAEQ